MHMLSQVLALWRLLDSRYILEPLNIQDLGFSIPWKNIFWPRTLFFKIKRNELKKKIIDDFYFQSAYTLIY